MQWHSHSSVARSPPRRLYRARLPTLGHAVPFGSQWTYEIKHDGFRFICRRDGDRVRVFSRRGYDWTDRVPLIAQALAALRVKFVTLDGEGVVCNGDDLRCYELRPFGVRVVHGRPCPSDNRRNVLRTNGRHPQ